MGFYRVANLFVFQRSLGEVLPGFGALLGAIAIIGLLTQAVIQTFKDLFPLRFNLQRKWLEAWLAGRKFGDLDKDMAAPEDLESQVEQDMLGLATSGDAKAFYSLPIEQLCGQLNAALRAALENPVEHTFLIAKFAEGAKRGDLRRFFNPPKSLRVNPETSPADRAQIESFAEARNRVAHHVERAIDGLQISVGSKWKRLLQISSYGLSIALALFGVGMYWHAPSPLYALRDALVVGFLAGYLAPIIRDILARVQQRAV